MSLMKFNVVPGIRSTLNPFSQPVIFQGLTLENVAKISPTVLQCITSYKGRSLSAKWSQWNVSLFLNIKSINPRPIIFQGSSSLEIVAEISLTVLQCITSYNGSPSLENSVRLCYNVS